jgi:hypothetical protein
MAKACQVSGTLDSGLTESEVPYESETHFTEEQELEQLINGHLCCKIYPFSGEAHGSDEDRKIILPGSFNPLHEGHLKLLEVAMSVCGGGYPCFEISAINADKPPLTIAQIKDRVKQFEVVGRPDLYFSLSIYLFNLVHHFFGISMIQLFPTRERPISFMIQSRAIIVSNAFILSICLCHDLILV